MKVKTKPYRIRVTRWVCGGDGCSRSFSRREAIEGHMETCWKVPENRSCFTCAHFQLRSCCPVTSAECGCRGERDWHCHINVEIKPGQPQVHCPEWVRQ